MYVYSSAATMRLRHTDYGCRYIDVASIYGASWMIRTCSEGNASCVQCRSVLSVPGRCPSFRFRFKARNITLQLRDMHRNFSAAQCTWLI